MGSLAIPLHTACYDILGKLAAPEAVDIDVLFEVLESHFPENSATALDLDYGVASAFQKKEWMRRHGFEYLVASPRDIPHIESLTSSILQDSQLGRHSLPSHEWESSSQGGIIHTVPQEVLEGIASHLDARSLCNFRLVSKRLAGATSANSFWRVRVSRDMPWMTEFLHSFDIQRGSVDWKRLYQTLQEIAAGKSSSPYIPGIRNRCRIWDTCSSLMDEYSSLKKRRDTESIKRPRLLVKALCGALRRLRYPVDTRTITKTAGLIGDLRDLSFAQPIISTYWTASGELAGIGTRWYKDGALTTLGSKDLFDVCQELQIPKDDWIVSLTVTVQGTSTSGALNETQRRAVGLRFTFFKRDPVQFGQAQGYQRLLPPFEGMFAVGFRATWSSGKPLAKLAILSRSAYETPRSKTRFVNPRRSTPVVERFMWKNELPPGHFHVRYEGKRIPCDRWSTEPLVFGTSDKELSNMISIAADVRLGGFEVIYRDGTRRSIGPRRHAMKHLSIDGPGGERIAHLYTALGPEPTLKVAGLRFVTNRGRQLVIGRHGPECNRTPPLWRFAGYGLTGIFGHWSENQDMDLIGSFSAPLPGAPENWEPIRSFRFYWDPAPPQRRLREASMAYGCGVEHIDESSILKSFSDKATTISWLDCEGTLDSIRVAFRQDTKASRFPLVSLSLTFADSHVSTVGPSEFHPADDTEHDGGPHYTHDTWEMQGSQLKTLRLWTDEWQSLTGLQFLAQNGAQSPRWGDCETEGPVELDLQSSSEGWAKGLKAFIDLDDCVVVKVQLIEIESYD